MTAEEIVAFAEEFDPQPFHLDAEAGQKSLLGGHAASGWHTIAVLMRMTYDSFLHETLSLGSPGVDGLKWVRPVLAGDTISGKATVLSGRRLKSRPDTGIVLFQFELRNQNREIVLVETTSLLIGAREPLS
ncbi:MAG: MaoC family dehydratase [Pseudomonadota bacterium]